jgi:hypothetical protein
LGAGLPEAGWAAVASASRVSPLQGHFFAFLKVLVAASHSLQQVLCCVFLFFLRCGCLQDINFSVVVTEGRPDGTGQTMARALDALGVPVTLVLDCGVAYALERYSQKLPSL